jgi:hypothetical protein
MSRQGPLTPEDVFPHIPFPLGHRREDQPGERYPDRLNPMPLVRSRFGHTSAM